ncbi:MAG: 4-phosphopantetheinyl transferase [Pseudolysinimonas sp.]
MTDARVSALNLTAIAGGVVVVQDSQTLNRLQRADALTMISPAERTRHRLLSAGRADEFLAGRLLLRSLAADLLGISPSEVPILARCPDCSAPHGRTVIEGSDLHVSLSHTPLGRVGAAMFGAAIGVDAEPIRGHPSRLAAIRHVANVESLRDWTRIEAVLKADGRGLRIDPRDVEMQETSSGVVASVPDSPTRYQLVTPTAMAGLVVSVAHAGPI